MKVSELIEALEKLPPGFEIEGPLRQQVLKLIQAGEVEVSNGTHCEPKE